MSTLPKATRTTVIPCLRYRDARAAVEWLCTHFGFEKQSVYGSDDGGVAHAQLTFGNGMVMLGSVGGHPSAWGDQIRQPDELAGAETQAPYLVVADADLVCAQARKAGAVIVDDIKNEPYGGRGFTCRDLEGHLWSFGTYDPWAPT